MIDLIDMKGIVWHDEDRGMSFETVPIPETMQETAEHYRGP